MELKDVKRFIENIKQDNIKFDPHFYKRSRDRPINEGLIRRFISQPHRLEKIEYGKNVKNRFKLWFKMSRKYSLVLIIEIFPSKDLNIISAWNSDRKWQSKLKQ